MAEGAENDAAKDLWGQIFARAAEAADAAIMNSDYDAGEDERKYRDGMRKAGWSPDQIEKLLEHQKAVRANAPVTSPGVNPDVEAFLKVLCADVESAMERRKINSFRNVARGIEPITGPHASLTNVIMTEQGIVTVGAFLFRFCGLVAKAFARTLRLNPMLWDRTDYDAEDAVRLINHRPDILHFWIQIYVSFALTGTHAMVRFEPATSQELLLYEQIARAMELFALAHEYGHHHLKHGRALELNSKKEELQADQFALATCYEIERQPLIFSNPYLSSGAGGVILLMANQTLRACREVITGEVDPQVEDTHPSVEDRVPHFDSVALHNLEEFAHLKSFRVASWRLMEVVKAMVSKSISDLPREQRQALRDLIVRPET